MSLALISDIETISDWIIDGTVLSGSVYIQQAGLYKYSAQYHGLLYVSTPWDLANQGHFTHMHCQETYVNWTCSCGPICKAYACLEI